MEQNLKNQFPNLKSIAMPSPIDLNVFKPINKEKARSLLGYSGNTERWVLFISGYNLNSPIKRFSWQKIQ